MTQAPHHIAQTVHNGQTFIELNTNEIDVDAMGSVQKVKDVYAFCVPEGEQFEIETISDGIVETTNTAYAGDWVVYNIGNSDALTLEEQLAECDKKVIRAEDFVKLYAPKEDEDDTNKRGSLYEYVGGPIKIARVPFPFYIEAPWGQKQYVQAGGYIVFNSNTKQWYGTAGAHHRKAGQLEKTYSMKADDPRTISNTFQMVIKADRSPLPGIQFNLPDLARAYHEAGMELGKLERYL